MAITAALIAAGSAVLGSILAPDGGGGGGGVSAKTQGGTNEVAFNPVGYETSRISPFEYMQLQGEFDQEQAQNMQNGGPLYRGKGGDIATGIFSQGIKDMMPSGILGLLLSSYFLDHENDNEEEESIVPGLNDGGGIGDLFDPELINLFNPDVVGSEVLSYSETGETNTQASASPTKPISSEEMSAETLAQLEQIMQTNKRNDALIAGGEDVLKSYMKSRNQKSSVRGRGNIVPGADGGGRANRQQRQKTASQGITPFQYRAMQGGGALNRQMFAQNYMPNGGDIRGPGGPKDDVIPVMASNGEYMLSKAAVDQAGRGNHARGIANLEQFNNRGNRRYG
jgi:hypothetical protein